MEYTNIRASQSPARALHASIIKTWLNPAQTVSCRLSGIRGWESTTVPCEFRVTTPTRYLSYLAALNLRLPGEDTGDWHGDIPFVASVDYPRTLRPAGPGGWSDTTPSLGSKGVRDMAHLLEGKYIPPGCGPVWGGQPLSCHCGLRAR